MDKVLDIQKVIGNLPSRLAPSTFYAVRVGAGYDLYLSDSTGSTAHRLNPSDELFIGGRNLLADSGTVVENGAYPTKVYQLVDNHNLKEGDEVVLTLWGQLADSKEHFWAYNSGGKLRLGRLDKISDGIYQLKTRWTVSTNTYTASNTAVNIYPFKHIQAGTSRIERIKLERGTTATDWTPAAEDIQAQNAALEARIRALEAKRA